MVDANPLTQVLIAMPKVGVKTAATILLNAGDFSSFAAPGHPAAYAGIARVTRRSEPRFVVNSPLGLAINSRKTHRSDRLGWRLATTRSRKPITRRNAPKARNTTPPSSVWPAASTSLRHGQRQQLLPDRTQKGAANSFRAIGRKGMRTESWRILL